MSGLKSVCRAALVAVLAGTGFGCVVADGPYRGPHPGARPQAGPGPQHRVARRGPPPHAPAHGYRHRHRRHGTNLVFDTGLGVYVVAGLAHNYFFRGNYYRRVGDGWHVRGSPKGRWRKAAGRDLPSGLKKRYARGKDKRRGRRRGRGRRGDRDY